MTGTNVLPTLTRTHREGFIDTLESLGPDAWAAPSLCAGWRVVDVAAHLAWAPVLSAGAGAVAMVRHGFSMNRMIARSAVDWSSRGREAILDQLRDNARTGARPVGMPPVAALADAVVHGLDVRRPLGLPGHVPSESLAPLADFTLGTPWPMNAVVGGSARRRVAGVRLVATDVAWSYGHGPEVRGSAEALLLLLYGRRPEPGELTGPGVDTLAARLGAP
ncbi:maleylpyruvate isomerase family mycothiol-dependent enzyme [Nocardioides ganghwensis]|uniref:Maleylpyruvate isomerase family mycothiol-dependent enzyme n=1 Tax=Nocardioides ganghwensis TaxID=252230 RepID=A0A4Q2SHK0_9ACTN|nr:maleylpyruvate isomerase family mycothiol-dependent enzyme [Nocardioides ganghwensis]MBD3946229.1 maleylpyruvate isomerase family mycothiol-dependent enzyme [Nocardioides ganghwensis]RYC03440.1 maleylpyruvate isomerase family mycothiol-dependent enzyme [Nocardioides ganghwensis]